MRRTLLPLIVVTAAAVALAIVTGRNATEAEDRLADELLLPGLSGVEAELAALRLARGGEALRLELGPEGWTAADLGGYPAKLESVAELVRGLAELRKVEPKTARPDRHARLGLEDPEAPESTATLVEALGPDGRTLAAVVLGRRYFELPGEHLFARLPGEDQTWLVSGSVRTPLDPLQWVDPVALALGGDAVERVERLEDGAPVLTVSRPDGEAFEWEVAPVPESQQVAPGGFPGRIGRLLANLRFDRVRPRVDGALSSEPAHHLRATTFDGLVVDLRAWPATALAVDEAVGDAVGDAEERLWVALDLSGPTPRPEDAATSRWLYRVDDFTAGAISAGPTQVFDALPAEEAPLEGPAPEGEAPEGATDAVGPPEAPTPVDTTPVDSAPGDSAPGDSTPTGTVPSDPGTSGTDGSSEG